MSNRPIRVLRQPSWRLMDVGEGAEEGAAPAAQEGRPRGPPAKKGIDIPHHLTDLWTSITQTKKGYSTMSLREKEELLLWISNTPEEGAPTPSRYIELLGQLEIPPDQPQEAVPPHVLKLCSVRPPLADSRLKPAKAKAANGSRKRKEREENVEGGDLAKSVSRLQAAIEDLSTKLNGALDNNARLTREVRVLTRDVQRLQNQQQPQLLAPLAARDRRDRSPSPSPQRTGNGLLLPSEYGLSIEDLKDFASISSRKTEAAQRAFVGVVGDEERKVLDALVADMVQSTISDNKRQGHKRQRTLYDAGADLPKIEAHTLRTNKLTIWLNSEETVARIDGLEPSARVAWRKMVAGLKAFVAELSNDVKAQMEALKSAGGTTFQNE